MSAPQVIEITDSNTGDFDTDKFKLRDNGFSLRLRQVGARHIQRAASLISKLCARRH